MSDLLIKDMEMPKSCDGCFVRLSLCSAARKIAKSGGPRMWVPTTYRPDDCPLQEIKPHGRLIDADALLSLDRQIYDGEIAVGRREFIFCFEVEDAPTIIGAEEEQ